MRWQSTGTVLGKEKAKINGNSSNASQISAFHLLRLFILQHNAVLHALITSSKLHISLYENAKTFSNITGNGNDINFFYFNIEEGDHFYSCKH